MDLTEQLMFVTCQVIAYLPDNHVSRGTGFIFTFNDDSDAEKSIPLLVTNKHVISGAFRTEFVLPYHKNDDPTQRFSLKLVQDNGEAAWIMHPEPDTDLCVLPLAAPLMQLQRYDPKARHVTLCEENVATQAELDKLSPIEDVIMIGYPIGLIDGLHNAPLVRKGITASHPRFDFNGRPIFMIDCACFPGSSGSPVFLLNNGAYFEDTTIVLGQRRFKFLGVMYSGPQMQADGSIEIVDIPTAQVSVSHTGIPTNLGNVIKAEKLLEFKELLVAAARVEEQLRSALSKGNGGASDAQESQPIRDSANPAVEHTE